MDGQKKIGFPDVYFLLQINVDELKKRKENDKTRRRSNFDKHLDFIKPQQEFFSYMDTINPGFVHFIQATTVEGNIENIFRHLNRIPKTDKYSMNIFDLMMEWFRSNS